MNYIGMIDEITAKIPKAGQPHAAGKKNPFYTVPDEEIVCASKCGIACGCGDED